MKTNLLLASLAASLFSVGAWGALPEGTELVAIEDGNYYLYNESLGKFLGRGAGWGTQAILDNYGVPFSLTTSNGVSTFKFLDSANTLGNAEGTPYTDNGYNSAYLIDGGSSSFSIYLDVDKNGQNAGYVSFDDNGKSKFVDSDGTTWVVKSIQERNDLVAANRLAQINAELKKAGISEVTSEDGISAALESADMALIDATGKIANADFTNGVTSWTWTAGRSNSGTLTGSNCVEVYQGTGTLSQSITVDNPGLYKVVFQAFQRAGSNANCVTVGNLGIILGNSYFSANDSYAVIPDWYTDRGGDANPNSMGDARTLFDAGKYTNDLYVYVGEDKTINLSYNIQSYMGAAWVIMDNVKLYYVTADLTSFKEAYEEALTAAKAVDQTAKMNSDVLKALQDAISASVEESKKSLVAATDALNAATANANECITAYAAAPAKFEAMGEFVKTTNAYTQEALDAYYTTPKAKYENNTLTTEEASALQDPNGQLGWHEANTVDDLLLSVWGVKDYESALYINTWSTEGNTDGSDFRVPFFEYWTSGASLGEKTWTATLDGLNANTLYEVSALVRLQQKNKNTPSGITLQVGDDTKCSAAVAGSQIGTSDLFLDEYSVIGTSDADGKLTVNFKVASGNNVSWLSFKNIVYKEAELADDSDIAKLKENVAKLNENVIGFEEGEYAVYNNYSQIKALEEVNSSLDKLLQSKYISKTAYESLVAKYNAIGEWTVNEEEVNAVYDGTFANAENDGAPAGWISSNNTLGGAYHARAFVNPSDNDISEFNETKSAFFLRFDDTNSSAGTLYHYGKTAGYTMPLKANTVYYVKADFKGWGSTGLPLRLNASDKSKTIKTTNQGNSDNVAPQHFYVVFKTTDAGDYTINFQNSGASETKNAIVSNIELKKVPVETRETATDKFGTVCLPYPFSAEGAQLYTVESVEENVVKLTEATEGAAGVAYIYQATENAQTFAVADGDITSDPATSDAYLTGVFESAKATAGNYVLQTQNEEQAFYQVAEGSEPTIGAYRAYLTVPSTEAALRISLNGEATGVEAVKALTEGKAEIYDLNGRKLNKLQKGINIVNGVKVIVK
jgi:hypothetical protein